MTPAARLQEAISVLDLIFTNRQPADQILHSYFRQRRFIGSKDRRYIGELVYETIRNYFPCLKGLGVKRPQARLFVLATCLLRGEYTLVILKEMLGQDKYGPQKLAHYEEDQLNHFTKSVPTLEPQDRVPSWIYPHLAQSFPVTLSQELDALDQTAPTDVRVNLLKSTPQQVLKDLLDSHIEAEMTSLSPLGVRLSKRHPLQAHPLWEEGAIEVQDEGSQLVSLLVGAKPGMQVFDYCAGAGGKTLAMAAMMENKGRIVATDTVDWRLERSRERLRRAGVFNVECRSLSGDNHKWLKRQEDRYDRVLLDVPCSGTGTWRRNPDLKIRLNEQDFVETRQKQQQILKEAHKLVKPGGRLIYATCSILRSENHDQVHQLLQDHQDFRLVPMPQIWTELMGSNCPTQDDMLQLTPAQHHVDGFFVAVMERLDESSSS